MCVFSILLFTAFPTSQILFAATQIISVDGAKRLVTRNGGALCLNQTISLIIRSPSFFSMQTARIAKAKSRSLLPTLWRRISRALGGATLRDIDALPMGLTGGVAVQMKEARCSDKKSRKIWCELCFADVKSQDG